MTEENMKAEQFVIKDSGQRQSFETGAVRDTQKGKARYDLIPPTALYRVAMHYGGGAAKYKPFNWAKGMNFSRTFASMFRHLMEWQIGDRSEDHLAALVFGALTLMHFEDTERDELNDMNDRWFHPEDIKNLNGLHNKFRQQNGHNEKDRTDTK